MRSISTLILAILTVAPLAAQAPRDADGRPFFLRRAEPPAVALQAYKEKPYYPIRAAEVRAAGFLTEDQVMTFGRALGGASASVNRAQATTPAVTALESIFEVEAPDGANYQPGDTLIVALVSAGPKGWGERVIPTGMVIVTESHGRHALGRVAAIYGPMRGGQVVYRAEAIANPGQVRPIAASGPAGGVIGTREVRELVMPTGHIYSDLGQRDGVKLGDFVEVRRDAADAESAPMATGQIVHLGPNSSTIKLMNVSDPEMPPGTPVVRVATLP
jgi:hypothetical protein